MLTEREEMIVRYVRDVAAASCYENGAAEPGDALTYLAVCIEAGEHLVRPSPTIPAEEWLPKSNVGHGDCPDGHRG